MSNTPHLRIKNPRKRKPLPSAPPLNLRSAASRVISLADYSPGTVFQIGIAPYVRGQNGALHRCDGEGRWQKRIRRTRQVRYVERYERRAEKQEAV